MKINQVTFFKLVQMFIVLTVLGGMASILYLYTLYLMPNAYLCLIAAGLFAYGLKCLTKSVVKGLSMPWGYAVAVGALAAMVGVAYVKWCCFFGLQYTRYELYMLGAEFDVVQDFVLSLRLMTACLSEPQYFFDDLVLFNAIGTWGFTGGGLPESFVTGRWLGTLWFLEFVLMTIYPALFGIQLFKGGNMPKLPIFKGWNNFNSKTS